MLKAYMWRMKYQEIVTPDSFYVGLTGLEQWAKQTKQPMDRAILHSLIAGIYADYAANNQWELRRRTEIVEEAPSADLREWKANIFVEKVRTNVKEALADSVLLLKTSSRDYIPFVELGETSEYYRDMAASYCPQAVKHILPSLVNEAISLLKESSILSYIGAVELLRAADQITVLTFRFFEPYLVIALIYYVFVMLLSMVASRVERWVNRSDRVS